MLSWKTWTSPGSLRCKRAARNRWSFFACSHLRQCPSLQREKQYMCIIHHPENKTSNPRRPMAIPHAWAGYQKKNILEFHLFHISRFINLNAEYLFFNLPAQWTSCSLFFFLINVGVRVSLRVLRLISRVLKLTTM